MFEAIISFVTGLLTAGPEGVSMAINPLLIAGGATVAQELFGGGAFGPSEGFRQRQQQRDLLEAGGNLLSPGRIGGQFQGLLDLLQPQLSPLLNAITQNQNLIGQTSANSIQARLARQGLGSTGLGAALGQGAVAGSAFAGNQLRARLQQDIINQAFGGALSTQGLKAQGFFNAAGANIGAGQESAQSRFGAGLDALNLINQKGGFDFLNRFNPFGGSGTPPFNPGNDPFGP